MGNVVLAHPSAAALQVKFDRPFVSRVSLGDLPCGNACGDAGITVGQLALVVPTHLHFANTEHEGDASLINPGCHHDRDALAAGIGWYVRGIQFSRRGCW